MAIGKQIRIYLAAGNATGIRHAELVNWTGQAFVCPRGRVSELKDWPESQRPGVYILLGDDPESSREQAYVGEAESVFDRLKQQITEREFWNRVIFFTSKDGNLTKAHVKYLESRVLQLATQAGRVRLENGNVPMQPALPRSERDSMEDFLGPLKLLLSTLGSPMLQSLSIKAKSGSSETEEGGPLSGTRLFFEVAKTGVAAEGASTDSGLLVFEGSTGAAQSSKSLTRGYKTLRDDLLQSGELMLEGGTMFVKEDILFSSPSAAAAVLSGTRRNGMRDWKDASGRSLKELEETLLEQKEVEP